MTVVGDGPQIKGLSEVDVQKSSKCIPSLTEQLTKTGFVWLCDETEQVEALRKVKSRFLPSSIRCKYWNK